MNVPNFTVWDGLAYGFILTVALFVLLGGNFKSHEPVVCVPPGVPSQDLNISNETLILNQISAKYECGGTLFQSYDNKWWCFKTTVTPEGRLNKEVHIQ